MSEFMWLNGSIREASTPALQAFLRERQDEIDLSLNGDGVSELAAMIRDIVAELKRRGDVYRLWQS